MSGPVDVLAVMDRAHVAFSGGQAREIYEARAAVAELVEAARRANLMLSVAGPMCGIYAREEAVFYDDAECDGTCVSEDCSNAAHDLTAALAKFEVQP